MAYSEAAQSRQVLDHGNDLVSAIARLRQNSTQVTDPLHDRTLLRSASHCDPPAPLEIEKTFFPKDVQGTKDGVLVHSEHSSNVLGQWQAFPWAGLALGDCSSYFGSDLVVQGHRL